MPFVQSIYPILPIDELMTIGLAGSLCHGGKGAVSTVFDLLSYVQRYCAKFEFAVAFQIEYAKCGLAAKRFSKLW